MTLRVLLNAEWLLCLCCINAELLQCRSLIWGSVKACLRWVLQDINGNAKWLHWTGSLRFPFLQKIALSKEHRQIRLIPKYSMLENCHYSTRDSSRVLLSKLHLQKLSTTPAFRVHLAAGSCSEEEKMRREDFWFCYKYAFVSHQSSDFKEHRLKRQWCKMQGAAAARSQISLLCSARRLLLNPRAKTHGVIQGVIFSLHRKKHQKWELQSFPKKVCLWAQQKEESVPQIHCISYVSSAQPWLWNSAVKYRRAGETQWLWRSMEQHFPLLRQGWDFVSITYRRIKNNNLLNIFWLLLFFLKISSHTEQMLFMSCVLADSWVFYLFVSCSNTRLCSRSHVTVMFLFLLSWQESFWQCHAAVEAFFVLDLPGRLWRTRVFLWGLFSFSKFIVGR